MEKDNKIPGENSRKADSIFNNRSGSDQYSFLSQEEIDQMWKEISSDLEIEELWGRISDDLDVVMPVRYGYSIILKSIAALIIILIGLVPVLRKAVNEIDESHPGIADMIYQSEQVTEMNLIDSEDGIRTQYAENKAIIQKWEEKTDNDYRYHPGVIIPQIQFHPDLVITTEEKIPEDKIGELSLPYFDQELTGVIIEKDRDSLKRTKSPSSGRNLTLLNESGRISAGLSMSFKNTWLLNNETFEGLRPASLNRTRIVFFPDIGINLNYSFNTNWQLQADAFFYSVTGQKYNKYESGHYISKEITLRYSTLAISARRRFPGGAWFPSGTTFGAQAGIYLSVLQQADLRKDLEIKDIGSQFQGFDIGLRLGGEIELPLTKNLSVAPGISLSLGFPNIYNDNDKIPGYLKRTRNGSEGFCFSFYYHFN